jgi:regulator of protease activity HflC (stomatin/prohibitin superfamily)
MPTRLQPPGNRSLNIALFLLIGLIAFAVFIVPSTFYMIPSGQVGVLATFGKYSEEIVLPGLHFKIPVIQTISPMDVKMQTAHYQSGTSISEKDGVISRPRIIVLDSKNLSIGMDITVQFTPDPKEAKIILEKYGNNYFDKLIAPIIRDSVRGVVSQNQAEDIAKERSQIASHLDSELRGKFENIPFILTAIQLRHIDLPEIVKQKIQEVQLAKQEEQRLAMIEKQAEKMQQIKTIEANTKLIEVTTEAKAQAERQKIVANAEAFQITVKSKARAEANELIAHSLTPELIQYFNVERWNGVLPETMLGDTQPTYLLTNKKK